MAGRNSQIGERLHRGGSEPERSHALQPLITGQASPHGALLMFTPSLIVLVVGARARQLDAVLGTVADDRLVHENAVIVGVESAQWEREGCSDFQESLRYQCLLAHDQ